MAIAGEELDLTLFNPCQHAVAVEFDFVMPVARGRVLSDRTLGEKKPKAAATQSQKKASQSAPKPSEPLATGQLTGAKAAPQPASLKPELATLVEHPPAGDWHYEIKFDGYRMLARVEKGEVKLFTRNGHDWTAKLPELAKAIASLKLESAWLDGEVVALDSEGVPSFQQLQQAFDVDKSGDIVFYLFDMPYLNGADLRNVPRQRHPRARHLLTGHMQGAFDGLGIAQQRGQTAGGGLHHGVAAHQLAGGCPRHFAV